MVELAPTPSGTSVLDAIHDRRAVRAYAQTPVEAPTIHELLSAAVWAPTAMHREPWAFAIVQDRALLRRLSERAKALLARNPAPGLEAVLQPDFDVFYDAGTLIVICAEPGPYAEADCWLAAENLMLAAHGLGLGTCVIGLATPALNEPDVKAELGLPEGLTAVAPIIVGVPRGETLPTTRKPPRIVAWK